jgi:hypothetical protein
MGGITNQIMGGTTSLNNRWRFDNGTWRIDGGLSHSDSRSILAALVVPSQLAAWGTGHSDVQRALLERLPAQLQDVLDETARRELIEKDSKYPDSFDPFEPERIGPAAMARLEKYRVLKRYDLHGDKGRGVAFLELAHALREGGWIGRITGSRRLPTARATWRR